MNCIHLDFHTSPDIDGVGEAFDKEALTRAVKESGIDLMTVFAKCHHGYTYYPSKVGQMHPGLKFNLLKEEIEAIHAAGAKAPIYITVGWSKKDADEHPDWHQKDFFTGKTVTSAPIPEDLDEPLGDCAWVALCPAGGYLDHLKDITREVCESFDTSDGVFYDICFVNDACACESCRRGARKMGLDPDSYEDAKRYYSLKRIEMMKTLTDIVHSYTPNATVFYNGGADMNRTEYHPYQTHYELEDLPTAWGGYDLMPLRAKFFEKYGKPFLGMTGKFHHAWGEFGGFKSREALRYECADMLSVGASISVGDHLHPSGKVDESTYSMIGHAFRYVKKIDKYCFDTTPCADIGIFLSHNYESDMGASKLLQIMHLEYGVIESGDDLSPYKCIILPDSVKLSASDEAAICEFIRGGGRVIASYESAFDALGVRRVAPPSYDMDYIRCDLDECTTPFLSYSGAYRVECDGEVLASVYEPYFSRTGRHFCGHKNTPNRMEAADYPALVKKGGVLYFAHPVFRVYNATGNYIIEKYIEQGIDRMYDRAIVTENLPSSGRVRLRSSKDGSLVLHLLYAPPINRGNVCLLPDFPTLHDVRVTIKTDKNVTRVRTEPDGEELEFTFDNGRLSFTLPPFSLHKLVLIDRRILNVVPGDACKMQTYIDIIEGAVSAYSRERIREYINEVEREGLKEHGFARLCANIGILIAYERRLDLKDIFYEMLDICCERMPASDAANDFTVREICSMLMLLEERGAIDPSVALKCRASFAAFDPWRRYTIVASREGETVGNWAIFNALSEVVRGIYCGIDTSTFVEHELSGQITSVDENGMYKDPGCPMVYDLVGRVLLAAMLHFGYRGKYAKDIESMLDRSAELTLLMQSPTGELPFGGRSAQFLHNEALLVAYSEMEATRNYRLGRGELASRFKGAAKLAAEHILSRLAEEPVSHIKNRYGRDSGIGCESYGYFNKYMVTLGSNIYLALLFGSEDISPLPAPATLGGYTAVTGDDFHKLFLNHSGYFLEIDTNADPHYDANGLGRVARAGCPAHICLSVPFARAPHYRLEGENRTQMSICPFVLREGRFILGASEEAHLSTLERRANAYGASASVKYDTDGESMTVRYDVSGQGVRMTSDEADGFMLPAFAFDGEKESEINLTRGAISIKYDNHSCRYSFDSEALVRDMGDYFNRNGRYRVYAVHSPSVHIEIE